MATSDLAREIAARVRRARDAAGISQSQLAAALGISQAAVSNLEAGTRPLRVEELVVLSRLLGKELDYFVAPDAVIGLAEPVRFCRLRTCAEIDVDSVSVRPDGSFTVAVNLTDPPCVAYEIFKVTDGVPGNAPLSVDHPYSSGSESASATFKDAVTRLSSSPLREN